MNGMKLLLIYTLCVPGVGIVGFSGGNQKSQFVEALAKTTLRRKYMEIVSAVAGKAEQKEQAIEAERCIYRSRYGG